MRRVLIVCVGLFGAAGTWLRADEGRIPVYQPVTITQPGHYVVTRDFSSTLDAISVQASNVTLDLGGHTISNPTAANRLISLADGFTNLTVRNGRLSGGSQGISYVSQTRRARVLIESVDILNPASYGILILGAEEVQIQACRVTVDLPGLQIGSAIRVDGVSGPFRGRFLDNTIETPGSGEGLLLSGLLAGEVRHNRVHAGSTTGSPAVRLSGPPNTAQGGNLVEGNTILQSAKSGLSIDPESNANIIINNVIGGNATGGVGVLSSGNRIANNVIFGNNGDGVLVFGSRNLIQDNEISNNTTFGIEFGQSAAQNAYRSNMLRGNTQGGVVDTQGTNTDEGANIP